MFFEITVSELSVKEITKSLNQIVERCPGRSHSVAKLQVFSLQLYQNEPVSLKKFVYFSKSTFHWLLLLPISFLSNLRNHHIRVFVKNLISFPDYNKYHFHFFYLFYSTNYLVYLCERLLTVDITYPTLFLHYDYQAIIKHTKRCRKLWSIR